MNRSRSIRAALALSALLLAFPVSAQETSSPREDSTAANKALVRRYVNEILTAGRLEMLDRLLAPDFVDSTPGAPDVRGPEVIRQSQQRARELFPEVEYTVDDLIAEGDKVVARYTVRATSKGSASEPGRPIEVTGVTIFRVADGKIREAWIVNDQVEMFLQLGFTLQPPKPREETPAPAPADQPAS